MNSMKLELGEIRERIDGIDDELLRLFSERMELAGEVAAYKKANGMPVFQGKREDEILERVADKAPDGLSEAARLLFTNIMDISKCIQRERLTEAVYPQTLPRPAQPRVCCQGTSGSYSEKACERIFGKREVEFYTDFEDVFSAVESGKADYGVLPIENSTAGEVGMTYDLMNSHSFFVDKSVTVRINHVLASTGTDISELCDVYSHEQALKQCSGFLRAHKGLKAASYKNTALAAKMAAESGNPRIGAICSADCAKAYGLNILAENIADLKENYTRFICISKSFYKSDDADTISICVSIPHIPAALYRLLTRFAYCGLNLTRIQSKPVPAGIADEVKESTFDAVFYLDFKGSIDNPSVIKLLTSLSSELKLYKFLGNYKELD